MKFTKMSLVAALLIGSSAFALDNIKVSGDAKLYYATDDASYDGVTALPGHTGSDSLFSAGSSAGQAALGLGITADLAKGVSAGVHTTVLTTLGLQGQLVNNIWEGTAGANDSWIVDEAWIAATMGKSTVKIGRMELDTPLTHTEKWSIAKNTFEAAVLINQDIPDTTIIGAYVGGSNGSTAVTNHNLGNPAAGIASVIQGGGNNTDNTTFSQYYNGAFAAAVINNSFKPLTVQAWYYEAPQFLDAIWLQADLGMKGVLAGVQYTQTNYNASDVLDLNGAAAGNGNDDDNDAVAVMLGFDGMKDMFTAKVAYSVTGTNTTGLGAGANIATYNASANSHSKLYTEAWWNYGYITRADTDSWNITVTSPVNGMFDLGVYYTSTSTGDNNVAGVKDIDMDELAITAGKTFGPLDVTLAYIYTNADDQNDASSAASAAAGGAADDGVNNGDDYNSIQVYLTLNF